MRASAMAPRSRARAARQPLSQSRHAERVPTPAPVPAPKRQRVAADDAASARRAATAASSQHSAAKPAAARKPATAAKRKPSSEMAERIELAQAEQQQLKRIARVQELQARVRAGGGAAGRQRFREVEAHPDLYRACFLIMAGSSSDADTPAAHDDLLGPALWATHATCCGGTTGRNGAPTGLRCDLYLNN